MYIFFTICKKYSTLSISLFSLLKDKIVKTVEVDNKFNFTLNFFNLSNFFRKILYLEIDVVFVLY
jgi:hypothetical protein